MLKRSFDLVAASFALILLSPVLAIIWIVIKLDSPGPPIFRQERVGRGGKLFEMLKFRTMSSQAWASASKITPAGDLRVTRAGRFFRRSKLDELPQLWNVVRGDMSLVGPRPEVPEYVNLYPDADRKLILSVRPGITDLAAIEFRDEAQMLMQADDPHDLYVNVILPRKLELYRRSIEERGFLADLRILARTLLGVFVRLGG